ncbi:MULTISPECIES: pyruvate, water dikinase regulatory protein [Afifella]|uniref:pyruvate, water dikinase regulatory protein n=1 Tax=Afifella TaxID=643217 RepID=UPI001F1BBB23|nr:MULTISPECIES: pyruvate, water dikinase regulatory protein [Afifella]MCF1505124.1 kinase/pyrophosphorylase [Afifella sp. H1R]MCT8268712.1 kinase/pyrophosphorylase [Afifella sp. JA880]
MAPTRFFHLHLISDATGETLINVGRAAAAQYAGIHAVEHIHSLVRTAKQIERIVLELENSPGIVLYTLVDEKLAELLEARCNELSIPAVSVLDPVLQAFQAYLGTRSTGRIGAQHALDASYFERIEALNFTMMHDDGQLPRDIDEADVMLLGVSRTSKTPTSIYLANRGIKTANLPIVKGIPVPALVTRAKSCLVVGLVASPDRIVQIRQNRVLSLSPEDDNPAYLDRTAVSQEVLETRRLCAKYGWPLIDVSRRSIEETAAAVLALLGERRGKQMA